MAVAAKTYKKGNVISESNVGKPKAFIVSITPSDNGRWDVSELGEYFGDQVSDGAIAGFEITEAI